MRMSKYSKIFKTSKHYLNISEASKYRQKNIRIQYLWKDPQLFPYLTHLSICEWSLRGVNIVTIATCYSKAKFTKNIIKKYLNIRIMFRKTLLHANSWSYRGVWLILQWQKQKTIYQTYVCGKDAVKKVIVWCVQCGQFSGRNMTLRAGSDLHNKNRNLNCYQANRRSEKFVWRPYIKIMLRTNTNDARRVR